MDLSFVTKSKQLANGEFIQYQDLELAGNDLVSTDDYKVPDIEGAKQSILATLGVYKGEWFLDNPSNPSYGIDYIGSVLGTKGVPEDILNSIFTDAILSDRYVSAIEELSTSLNNSTRQLTVSFVCTIKGGLQLEETLKLKI